jgi:hypothetical protein
MKQRAWNDADRRAFAENKLRAQTVPARRDDGPEVDEWDDDPVDLIYEWRYGK